MIYYIILYYYYKVKGILGMNDYFFGWLKNDLTTSRWIRFSSISWINIIHGRVIYPFWKVWEYG